MTKVTQKFDACRGEAGVHRWAGLRGLVPTKRAVMCNAQGRSAPQLGDDRRKPIRRLRFNSRETRRQCRFNDRREEAMDPVESPDGICADATCWRAVAATCLLPAEAPVAPPCYRGGATCTPPARTHTHRSAPPMSAGRRPAFPGTAIGCGTPPCSRATGNEKV